MGEYSCDFLPTSHLRCVWLGAPALAWASMTSSQSPTGAPRGAARRAGDNRPGALLVLLPLLVLAGGAAATVWVHRQLAQEEDNAARAFFKERIGEVEVAIRARLAHYADALHSGASLLTAVPETDQARWGVYAESLDLRRRYPGINGLGFILAVAPGEVEAWQARVTVPGQPVPAPRPFPGAPPGPADAVRYLITAVESNPPGAAPIGRDIATDPSRREAAEQARDTGLPHLNRRIAGSRDTQRRSGLILYVPLYRRGLPLATVQQRRTAHLGWVYAQIFPEVFLDGVLGALGGKLELHFFEGGKAAADRLLYASTRSEGAAMPRFESVTELTLAGESFLLGWNRGPRFPAAAHAAAHWMAASTALSTLLLSGLVLSLLRSNRRAHHLTLRRTAELAASEERFRQAFDLAGIGMAIVAMDGQLIRVNRSFCEIVGYPEDKLLRKRFQDITHPEDLAADLALLEELVAGQRQHYQLEKRYIHRDGQSVWVRLTVTLVRDDQGRPLNAIAQLEDIAERKRLEAAAARAREEVTEQARAKTDFLATIVHEVRTPANDLVGALARVRNRAGGPLQPEYLHALEHSGDAFLKVLSNLLEYWDLEFNRVELKRETLDLPACIAAAMARHEGLARQKRLKLETTIAPTAPPLVVSDGARLGQVLDGLLSNAIKFTEAGEIRLTLTAEPIDARTGQQRLKFAVRDTGSGIAANATYRAGGAIELAISTRLTELLGGMLWSESELGRGTTYHFTIPVAPRSRAG